MNPNVQVVSLPSPNAPCPAGRNLVISGWGSYIIWDKSETASVILGKVEHKFLWALKQRCGDLHECGEYTKLLNDSGSLMCAVGPSTSRNGPYKGDSGGKNFLPIQVYIFLMLIKYST